MSAESTMRWLLLTIRWAANQRIARSHCLQGKWLATKLRTSRPKLPRRSSAVSRRHLVNTLRSWVHCAQPVDVNHLVVSTVWLGSPRETKGISRSRDTGKSVDSKWPTQTGLKSPSPFWNVEHLAAISAPETDLDHAVGRKPRRQRQFRDSWPATCTSLDFRGKLSANIFGCHLPEL